jgi:hypothetical protein
MKNKFAAAYRRRHRKAGLCSECPRKARPGKRQCAKCAERGRLRRENDRRELETLRWLMKAQGGQKK